jgi:sugar phosphate isomerase/epimerase
MRLGILQGRLSPPIGGFQEFPVYWKKEFELLDGLGLNHIEWIVTKQSFDTNPLFSEDLSNYPISSICVDNLIDPGTIAYIYNVSFLRKNLKPICDAATLNDISTITIPLLEESDITNDVSRSSFINEIRNYGLEYPHLTFSFEIESYEHVIQEVLEACPNFRLTYDTGNMTSLGISHEYYLTKFIHKIDTVHLKDRTFESKTVPPGKGKTDFKFILNYLSSHNHINYTIQTDRGESGEELDTIIYHKNFFKSFA